VVVVGPTGGRERGHGLGGGAPLVGEEGWADLL